MIISKELKFRISQLDWVREFFRNAEPLNVENVEDAKDIQHQLKMQLKGHKRTTVVESVKDLFKAFDEITGIVNTQQLSI